MPDKPSAQSVSVDYEYLLWQIAGMARADLAPSERLDLIYRMAMEKKTMLELLEEPVPTLPENEHQSLSMEESPTHGI